MDATEPTPSPAEQLAAEHPDWDIHRELHGRRHGDWIAHHLDDGRLLRAATVEGLADELAGAS